MANTTATVTVTWGNGRNALLAGTPLDEYGHEANNGSAYGILAQDLYMPDRSATVITAGEWDEEISRMNGIPISDAAKAALSAITFNSPAPSNVTEEELEEILADYVTGTSLETTLADYVTETGLSGTLEDYAQKTELPGAATTSAAGTVKMAEAVADSEETNSPTTAEFNALLAALRTAGSLETPAPEPAPDP